MTNATLTRAISMARKVGGDHALTNFMCCTQQLLHMTRAWFTSCVHNLELLRVRTPSLILTSGAPVAARVVCATRSAVGRFSTAPRLQWAGLFFLVLGLCVLPAEGDSMKFLKFPNCKPWCVRSCSVCAVFPAAVSMLNQKQLHKGKIDFQTAVAERYDAPPCRTVPLRCDSCNLIPSPFGGCVNITPKRGCVAQSRDRHSQESSKSL